VIEHQGSVVDETREQLAGAAAFLRRMRRFWRTTAVILVLGGAAAVVFLLVRSPTYRSEAVVLYTEGVRGAEDAERRADGRSVTVRLKEILMSRASLDAVVRQFDLYPEVRRKRGAGDAAVELRQHVEFRAPGGDTFAIAFTGSTPSEAQAVTARLAELVIGQDSELRKKRATMMRDFLETERRSTDARLRDAETALASFIAAHPRFALDATPFATGAAIRASLGGATPQSPQSGVVRRRVAPPQVQDVAGAAGPRATPAPAPALARERDATAEEGRASAALAAARANLTELSVRFTAAHPDVRAAQAEVDRATSRLTAARSAALAAQAAAASAPPPRDEEPMPEVRAVAPPARAPVVVTPAPEPRAATAPSAVPVRAPDMVALETEWVRLTRGVTEARQHQDEVERALFKANTAVSSETGGHGVEVTMIDPAFLPQTPVPPGRSVIVAFFASGALLLGLVGALVRAVLDDSVYVGRDVGRLVNVLVEVPRASSRSGHGAS
jgi:polysaccharide biosynthesis transport protein